MKTAETSTATDITTSPIVATTRIDASTSLAKTPTEETTTVKIITGGTSETGETMVSETITNIESTAPSADTGM